MTNLSMITTAKLEDAASLYSMSIEEIADRVMVMQHQETTSYRPVDYLRSSASVTTTTTHSSSSSPSSSHLNTNGAYESSSSLSLSSSSSSSSHENKSLRERERFNEEHRQSRAKMCHWCYQLADICKLSRHAASRSMIYLDRFLATALATGDNNTNNNNIERAKQCFINPRDYQLAAMTSLYISIKLHEPLALDASLMAEISQGCYTTYEILQMERVILQSLQWNMNGPTCQEYVALYLGLLDPRSYGYDLGAMKKLLDVCVFQCELAVGDYDLAMHFTPSIVALGCVLNGFDWVMADNNNGDDNDGNDYEGSSSIISEDAQFDFMRRLCELLLLRNNNGDDDDDGDNIDDDGVDAMSVEFVRTMLRRSFRRNSGVDVDDSPSSSSSSSLVEDNDDDDEMEEVSSNDGCDNDSSADVESKRRRRRRRSGCNNNKVDRMQCDDDVKCSSPVCVVAPAS
mmetsp:Transcript_22551/g.40643  ORF Transcript_22551/g.40643 Transcript_22551/m.40643 type:complete len:458 (+) Transcript_22551:134-1507(+)|eukprot:CAMPEP_0196142582 /NCGR_PEP_ID=MMETSP0910-20130528/11830_1 /TAXON_ID=49265 /ORGANISM="Thalassiosira rotula, Strain GSO102" /LENGTH=457 /DNA_ID=CAMNT_0041403907 /DNA_START=103 /DNA_END=1476 /DNA_ORIENTATION=+